MQFTNAGKADSDDEALASMKRDAPRRTKAMQVIRVEKTFRLRRWLSADFHQSYGYLIAAASSSHGSATADDAP